MPAYRYSKFNGSRGRRINLVIATALISTSDLLVEEIHPHNRLETSALSLMNLFTL